MSLQLRWVLEKYRLTQPQIRSHTKQHNGQPLSSAAFSRIMWHDVWPKLTDANLLKKQIKQRLAELDVHKSDLIDVFEFTPEVEPNAEILSRKKTQRQPETIEVSTEMLSQQARKHFGLLTSPFHADVTQSSDVFLSSEQKYILKAMEFAATHAGFMAVIGESGAGKSTLRRELLNRLAINDTHVTSIMPKSIDKAKITAGALSEAIIKQIDPARNVPSSLESRARLVEQMLADSSRAGSRHCLIVEEAHDLSKAVLKQLKRFWELEDGHTKLIGIILVGQPELKLLLNEATNYDAREVIRRIEVAELLPLDRELEGYLSLKFKRVHKSVDEVLTADAYDAIRQRLSIQRAGDMPNESQVYPLLVNLVVTKAMNQAALIGEDMVSAELIREV